jgi:phospholipid/cholesterol/gamma-HCH transport system substrate-binding protein
MAKRNLLVGIFVVAGITLFAIGVFLIGDRHQAFSEHVEFYTEFADLSGLTNGSNVRVGGMDAGKVVAIQVPDSPSSQFRVRMRVNEKMHGLVRGDSLVTIETAGVVGETFLLIHPGSPNVAEAAALAILRSKPPVEMAALLGKGSGLLDDADGMLKTVGGKLNGTLDGISTAVGNTNDLLVGLKEGRGPAGMLLRDKNVEAQIRSALANVQEATSNINHASAQVDTLMSDVQSRQLPLKIDQTMDSVKDAAGNIDQSSARIRQTLTTALAPDARGIDAGQNINESLSNLNIATGNMSEDTEALKHNFFFRKFFNKRGYFNLSSESPDAYRHDRLFASPANYRAWIPTAELFVVENNGVETLTPAGQRSLDAALAKYGEALTTSPMVIEGYSNATNAAEGISSSYERALQVRHYLEAHFHLQAANVGVIALKDSPPAGLGHEHWDGISIVIPNPRH